MLKSPPDEKHLSRIYFELSQLGAACSGEKYPWPYRPKSPEELLTLAAEMSRYDPRLLGILVEFLLKQGSRFSPQRIREQYLSMSTPQTFAVIAEFVKTAAQDPELIYLMEYLQKGLKPVSPQLYYKTIYTPGGRLSQRAAEEPLAQYKKWGFLAREAPTVDVYQKKTVGHMDRDSRRNALKRLFKEKGILQLRDYLKAIGETITRQQALKDLEAVAKLRRGVRGRGAAWELKKR